MRPCWETLILTSLGYVIPITSPNRPPNPVSFTTIDVPGATETRAFSTNNAGEIVGEFKDAKGKAHGFLRASTGTFTTIDAPGATETHARGINRAGQIVGWFEYDTAYGGDQHDRAQGFVRASTGAFSTIPRRTVSDEYVEFNLRSINSAGYIAGNDGDSDGGFVRSPTGTYTSIIRAPGVDLTMASGISDAGQVVGSFFNTNHWEAYLRTSTGRFTTINVPGATETEADAINGAGEIVGTFGDAQHQTHAFVRSSTGSFAVIDVPDATSTFAAGINAAGQIVGWYGDAAHKYHGFVTTR